MTNNKGDFLAVFWIALVVLFWILSVLFSLAFTGVVIWAIYELVVHYVLN
jgi:hypothetical protein